jgi:hypothetical protein
VLRYRLPSSKPRLTQRRAIYLLWRAVECQQRHFPVGLSPPKLCVIPDAAVITMIFPNALKGMIAWLQLKQALGIPAQMAWREPQHFGYSTEGPNCRAARR